MFKKLLAKLIVFREWKSPKVEEAFRSETRREQELAKERKEQNLANMRERHQREAADEEVEVKIT